MKITRHNNQIYRRQNEELTVKTEKLENRLKTSEAELKTRNDELSLMKSQHKELKSQGETMNMEKNEMQLKIRNLESLLEEYKTEHQNEKIEKENEKNQLTLTIDIMKQELKKREESILRCNEEKMAHITVNLSNQKLLSELKSNHSSLSSKFETESANLIVAKIELEECQKDLQKEMTINQKYLHDNHEISEALNKSESEALFNWEQAEICDTKLSNITDSNKNLQSIIQTKTDEITVLKSNLTFESDENSRCKTNLGDTKSKLDLVCPLWSNWSDCSKSCDSGTRKRMNKCETNDTEFESCNDHLCVRSRKYNTISLFEAVFLPLLNATILIFV